MASAGTSRFSTSILGLASTLLWAAPAAATPVTHTVNPALSSLSGNLSASFDLAVVTSLGTVNGDVSMSGSLASSGSGNLAVDWGNPIWSDSLSAAPFSVTFPSPGSGSGGGGLDLFGFIPINFDLDLDVQSLTLSIVSAFDASPLAPSEIAAGSGPWAGSDVVTLALQGEFDLTITLDLLPISLSFSDLLDEPFVSLGAPLVMSLQRLGGDPGTGSRVSFGIPAGLNATVGPLATIPIAVPGCEVDASLACAFDVEQVRVTPTSVRFSDVNGTVVADQVGTVIPEPSTLALLALGMAALAVAARRSR